MLGMLRLPGEYQRQLERERRRVVEWHPAVDPRLMLYDAEPEVREAAWAEARAHPLASELLDRLELDEPVVVPYRSMSREFNVFRASCDAPEWTRDSRNVKGVLIYADDVIAPVYND